MVQPTLAIVEQNSSTPGRTLVLQSVSRMQSFHKHPLRMDV